MQIRHRLFLWISLTAIVVFACFAALTLAERRRELEDAFEAKIAAYSAMAPELFKLHIWNMDLAATTASAEALASDVDLSYLRVKDEFGSVLYSAGEQAGPDDRQASLSVENGGYTIGTVDLGFSRSRIKESLGAAATGLGLTLLALLAVLTAVVFWISSSITRPLYRMVDALTSIGAGDLDSRVEGGGHGELAALASTINGLTARIREREDRIRVVCDESAKLDTKYHLERQRFELEQQQRLQSEQLRKDLEESLSNLRTTQEQLIASEKMAVLGSLVAGIAHEINTPIGVAVTAASYAQERSREYEAALRRFAQDGDGEKAADESLKYVGEMEESSGLLLSNLLRASEIIRGFKQVSVDQASAAKRDFDLRGYLDEIVLSLHPRLKRGHYDVRIACPAGLCLSGYPGVLSQILTNLIINSLVHGFAGTDRGGISIRAAILDGGVLRLRYADDGRGVSDEELAHIFEPFRTTMRNEGGSGLGTYIVYTLVTQKLRGKISADNARGLSYTMEFPVETVSPGSAP